MLPPIGERGGVTRHRVLEVLGTTKILPIGVFQSLRPLILCEKLAKGVIQDFPINQMSQLVKFVFWI
jgi:hypothetical protein